MLPVEQPGATCLYAAAAAILDLPLEALDPSEDGCPWEHLGGLLAARWGLGRWYPARGQVTYAGTEKGAVQPLLIAVIGGAGGTKHAVVVDGAGRCHDPAGVHEPGAVATCQGLIRLAPGSSSPCPFCG